MPVIFLIVSLFFDNFAFFNSDMQRFTSRIISYYHRENVCCAHEVNGVEGERMRMNVGLSPSWNLAIVVLVQGFYVV